MESPRTGAGPGPRIALVTNDAADLVRSRASLLRLLNRLGADVAVVGPGARRVPAPYRGVVWDVDRRSLSPLAHAAARRDLERVLRELRPDLVHAFTIKPNVYAVSACRRLGIPVVCSVTGLGYAFTERGPRGFALRAVLRPMYARALRRADAAVFQNADDRRFLGLDGLGEVVPGSGVDVTRFRPDAASAESVAAARAAVGPGRVVLMVARLLRHKGVEEFCAASRILRASGADARLVLVGPLDPGNPAAYSADEARALVEGAGVTWVGGQEDVRPWLALADVVALPSHREGLPRAVLEAMAMGRPVVACDAPGCRDAVAHERSGLLVPVGDAAALAAALRRLLDGDAERRRFGGEGMRRAREEFADEHVLARFIAAYAQALRRHDGPALRARGAAEIRAELTAP